MQSPDYFITYRRWDGELCWKPTQPFKSAILHARNMRQRGVKGVRVRAAYQKRILQ